MSISAIIKVLRLLMRKKNSGFTLIETTVVLVIIALLFGLVVPSLSRSRRQEQRAAVRKLSLASRYLLQEAVAQRSLFWLIIDMEKQRWYVEKPKIDYAAGTVERVRYTDRRLAKEYKLPEGIRFVAVETTEAGRVSSGNAVIRYLPTGFVDPAIIQLEDPVEDRKWSLVIEPLTGFTDIKHEHVELQTY